ncbi:MULTISPECIES: RNA polymerase sigma factor [Sphingobacterium]|uniref:RNA polymerase sigma-70 factor (ECF subfamily) n=1 Tax=Sphingobacterium detergens TaxID=1145106 RepID=A0A420B6M4_SPHD1|nr:MULTISPECIES: sigma-70 family RNA polymerase sigma factor [Sphingobacterium]MCS4229165.1 RNA polymerase sigma-70 factor (ECF subfamily) [Sphingobacterium sp. BIGb0165]RKE52323.1 RNA polymerase sigma-70 factor (ECF subfamily) [Sphingobacterium detergens]
MNRDDVELIEAINNADPIAFKRLFDTYWKKIYRTALQKLPTEEDASDITQDVFYIIWKNRAGWQVKSNIAAYLMSMLRHKIYDFYAQRDRLPIFVPINEQEEYWDYSFQEGEQQDFAAENQQVRKEIDAMPEKMREIFLLSRFENLSAQQIADKLGITVQTVRNQISTALKRIKNRFGDKATWLLFLFFIKF